MNPRAMVNDATAGGRTNHTKSIAGTTPRRNGFQFLMRSQMTWARKPAPPIRHSLDVTRRSKARVCLFVAVLVGSIGVATAAASTPWRTHHDAANRFLVSTPSAWIWVPQTRAGALELAARLKARGDLRQAALLRSYLNDVWQSDPSRIFDAIEYPPTGAPIATDLVVTRRASPAGVAPSKSVLQLIAQTLFAGLKKSAGVRMNTPKPIYVSLNGSPSFRFDGSVPAAGFSGRRTGFDIFVLLDAHGLYNVEFRTDDVYLARQLALFRRIADTIRLG